MVVADIEVAVLERLHSASSIMLNPHCLLLPLVKVVQERSRDLNTQPCKFSDDELDVVVEVGFRQLNQELISDSSIVLPDGQVQRSGN